MLAVGLMAMLGATTQAALTPVFEYSFPTSYDGTTTTVTDLSLAGHNATMNIASDAVLADVRPAGFTSEKSLLGSMGGYGVTNEISLLTNSTIAEYGGYTLDTWFMANTVVARQQQLVSVAGTDSIQIGVQANILATFYADNGSGSYVEKIIYGPKIETGRWYHVVSRFDTNGYQLDENGFITGELSLIVDGIVLGSQVLARHTFGDSLNRPIGINCRGQAPSGTTYYNISGANLFNPEVFLGVEAIPAQPKAGDANNDGIVDENDAAILAKYWQTTIASNWWGTGDFNGDQIVDDIDATLLATNWSGASSSASVPEPSGLLYLTSLFTLLCLRRKLKG